MFVFFILGLVIGSFLNVLIHRIPRNENFINSRSYCDSCKKTLPWYDLVPIFSFILLSGRCRFCKKKISPQILLVEATTGILFAAYFLKVPSLSLNFFLTLGIISSLIVIFFIDAKQEIIPDKILLVLIFLGIFLNLNHNFQTNILSAITGFIFFFLIYSFSGGRAMGFGDVKYAGVIGLVLGYPVALVSYYLSFLTGGITSLILVLWGKKKLKKDTIPFGPFLSIGAILSIFLGEVLVSRLLSFLQF